MFPTSQDKADVVNALKLSADENPMLRDINPECSSTYKPPEPLRVLASNTCWEQVHPDEYSVYDFTYWTRAHKGNKAAADGGRPNPIMKFAVEGGITLEYPSNHPMMRWEDNKQLFDYVGRLEDVVPFDSIITELQTNEVAEYAGAVLSGKDNGFQACGNTSEAENEPALGHKYFMVNLNIDSIGGNRIIATLDQPSSINDQKKMVWANVALKANDQLRQRFAWALSDPCRRSQ